MTARPDAKGSPLSRRLCTRYILKDPLAFRDFFVPKVTRRRYLQRYTFVPITCVMGLGDSTLEAGRASGKSFGVLEPGIPHAAVSAPGEETVVTSFRKNHMIDRMERAIQFFTDSRVPFLPLYVKHIWRQPIYDIHLKNDHHTYGLIAGDDPESKQLQGKHASRIFVEEAHQYPGRAWLKLQGAMDPRGCVSTMFGVPDGRVDTPFRDATHKYESTAGRRHRISRRTDPYWTQIDRRKMAERLGGEHTDAFIQEVDAEWGSPSWGAWNMDAIIACQETQLEKYVCVVDGKIYRGGINGAEALSPESALPHLPSIRYRARHYIAVDVGYTEPSEVGIFSEDSRGMQTLMARIELVGRMEHHEQAPILAHLMRLFRARIGIDCTGGDGRAIAGELELIPEFAGQVQRVVFTENVIEGYDADGVPVEDTARLVSTRLLRTLFSRHMFVLPVDGDIIGDFNSETEQRDANGIIRVKTPTDVHIPDMFRVMAMMIYAENPPEPADGNTEEVIGEIEMALQPRRMEDF